VRTAVDKNRIKPGEDQAVSNRLRKQLKGDPRGR